MPQSTRLYTAGQGNGASQARRVAINVQGANNASLPAKQSLTTTAETQIVDPILTSIPLTAAIPPGGPCEQEPFELLISGYVTTTQSATVIFKLYVGDSATIGSNTPMATFSTSAAISTTTAPFFLRAVLVYDSVSGKLTGTFNGIVQATITAVTVINSVAVISGSFSNTNNPVITFTLTAQFSAATTANVVNVKDFGINH